MKNSILLLLLLEIHCFGQAAFDGVFKFTSGGGVGSMTPTNLGGSEIVLAWYEPSRGAYTTNSSTGTLPNLTSSGSVYNLTNDVTASLPSTLAANLNGLDVVSFSSASIYLWNTLFTNIGPQEIFAVVAITNTGFTDKVYWDGAIGNGWRFFFDSGGAGSFASHGASTVDHTTTILNKYIVVNQTWNGASSALYTNGVIGATGNPLTGDPQSGLGINKIIGSTTGGSTGLRLATWFAFTNTTLSVITRSNAFWYCTNRFNISL